MDRKRGRPRRLFVGVVRQMTTEMETVVLALSEKKEKVGGGS